MLIVEIERKFLVNEIPNTVHAGSGMEISQGYLLVDNDSEVRVRQFGEKHYLTSKNGNGLQREETEIPISRKQFELLWPVSLNRRLEKERHIVKLHNGFRAELDIYKGILEGLQLVEVEFPNVDEADQFDRPAWFGPEVTEDPQFANKHLACYGRDNLPVDLRNILEETRHSVGSIPVMQSNGMDHFIVVSTRNNLRWIFPKGNSKDKLEDEQAAAEEAFEEAGVTGETYGPPHQVHYWKGYTHYIIDYYPMLVSTLHKKWPEKEERQRRVCTFDEAAELLYDSGFVRACYVSLKRLRQNSPQNGTGDGHKS